MATMNPSDVHFDLLDRTPRLYEWDGEDVPAWQARLRPRLAEILGMHRMPIERPPLNVRSLWTREHELGSIEKIVFTAEPHADVPAYLCLPKSAEPPYTPTICLQGHSTGMHNSIAVDFDDETQPIEVAGDRDFGLGAMRRGVAALCIEQRYFGERAERGIENSPGCYGAGRAFALGRTAIGERVYDVDRAIDVLAARDDMDMSKLGVMGNSGGGTISVFAAAMLDRLRIAMPSCYFCTFRDSIMSLHHCICNFVPHIMETAEMADVLGLFAPRPVVVVAGKDDDIFPIDAVRSEFERLKAIYAAAGAEDRCHLLVGPEGHRFYADLAWPVALEELGRL